MQITSNNKNPMVSTSILIVTSDKVRAGILHERLKMLGYKVVGIAASRVRRTIFPGGRVRQSPAAAAPHMLVELLESQLI